MHKPSWGHNKRSVGIKSSIFSYLSVAELGHALLTPKMLQLKSCFTYDFLHTQGTHPDSAEDTVGWFGVMCFRAGG